MKFVTDVFDEKEANVIFFGVECPDSIREVSQLVEPFDFTDNENYLENVRIFDSGNVGMDGVEGIVKKIISENKFPLFYSKEHTASFHAMKAMPEGTKLVVFDAHADLKNEYEGSKDSHACWLRRWCEFGRYEDIIVLGVRSGDEWEAEFAKENNIRYFTVKGMRENSEDVKRFLSEFTKGSKVYLSVDMDVFDPSIVPAVKYPEPDGLSYNEFFNFIESMDEDCLAGMDFNELRPFSENRISEFLSIKIVFKLLSRFISH